MTYCLLTKSITIKPCPFKLSLMKLIHHILLSIFFLTSFSIQSQNINAINILDSIASNEELTPRETIALIEKNELSLLIPTEKQDVYTILGDSYYNLEMYDMAFKAYQKALELSKKTNNHIKTADLYKDMGAIAVRIEDYEKSLELNNHALALLKQPDNNYRISITKGNIAIAQSKVGQVETAILTLKTMLDNKLFNPKNQAITEMTLGNIYLEQLIIPEKAITYYNSALKKLKKEDSDNLKIMLLQNISESYIALKDYKKGLIYNNKSATILKRSPRIELQASLHKFYAQIYEAKNEYTLAHKNLKLYHELKDSLNNISTKLKIDNNNTIKAIEKYKLTASSNQNKLNTLKKEQAINYLRTIVLILTLAIILTILYFNIKASKRKIKQIAIEKKDINNELNFNKSNLEKITLKMTQNNEHLNDFSQKIKKIALLAKDKTVKEELSKLNIDLQTYKSSNHLKDELKQYLKQVNDNYAFKLNQKFPELTEEEQQLCILIFINLKNKDISNLLNLSIRSVENKRYRIRKKMNLKPSESLLKILQSINKHVNKTQSS